MIAHVLKSFFEPFIKVPVEVWEGFAKYLSVKYFDKNEIIKSANKKEKYLYVIVKGSAGLFVSKNGHDICIDLCYPGQFTGDYYSLLQQQINFSGEGNKEIELMMQQHSPIYVMALEQTEAYAISKNDLHTLYEQSEIGKMIARKVAELLYMQKQNQQIELLTMTAEERYMQILQKYPEMLLNTANKHIASYLGVSPESMSRIKKKVAN